MTNRPAMRSRTTKRQILSIVSMIAVWQAASWMSGDPSLVPPADALLVKLLGMIASLELLSNGLDSLRRVVVAFVFGALAGVFLGLMSSAFRPLWTFLEVPLDFVRSIPPIGFVPLVIAWFGIGELSKYLVIGYLTVIVVAFSTVSGIRQVDQTRIRAARCMGLAGWGLYWRVIIPSASRNIISALHLAIGLSFISLVAVEIIGATSGLGFIIMDSRLLLQTDRMIVAIVAIGVLGMVTVWVFDLLLRAFGLTRFSR